MMDVTTGIYLNNIEEHLNLRYPIRIFFREGNVVSYHPDMIPFPRGVTRGDGNKFQQIISVKRTMERKENELLDDWEKRIRNGIEESIEEIRTKEMMSYLYTNKDFAYKGINDCILENNIVKGQRQERSRNFIPKLNEASDITEDPCDMMIMSKKSRRYLGMHLHNVGEKLLVAKVHGYEVNCWDQTKIFIDREIPWEDTSIFFICKNAYKIVEKTPFAFKIESLTDNKIEYSISGELGFYVTKPENISVLRLDSNEIDLQLCYTCKNFEHIDN